MDKYSKRNHLYTPT